MSTLSKPYALSGSVFYSWFQYWQSYKSIVSLNNASEFDIKNDGNIVPEFQYDL